MAGVACRRRGWGCREGRVRDVLVPVIRPSSTAVIFVRPVNGCALAEMRVNSTPSTLATDRFVFGTEPSREHAIGDGAEKRNRFRRPP